MGYKASKACISKTTSLSGIILVVTISLEYLKNCSADYRVRLSNVWLRKEDDGLLRQYEELIPKRGEAGLQNLIKGRR